MMSDTTISVFETLPVEVFHRILNHLDTSEVFYSLYNVCRRINAFLISYNRYKLDFSAISRFDFDIIGNIVEPKNIISLVLSDDDHTPGQIGLFLSLFNIQEFHRLSSLSLLQIEERHLIVFLQHVSLHNLCSLTIHWRSGARFRGHALDIHKLLSSTVSQPNLRYLKLSLWIYGIKSLPWPNHCFLEYLCIDDCSFCEYQLILHQSPHLKTFISTNCSIYDVDDTFSSPSFVRPSYFQLCSLSLKNIKNIRRTTLKSLLSITPSLEYLKLTGSGRLSDHAFNGSRWESSIQLDLRSLKKFEFFFVTQRHGDRTVNDVSSLIIPFSSGFWREKKRWFVQCDFIKSLSQIRLYSIPICQSQLEYVCKSDIISQSTLITVDDDAVDRMAGIYAVSVNLSAAMTQHENYTNSSSIFHQATELELEIDDQWPNNSLQFLSTILNLSHLVKISFNIYFNHDFTPYTINAIISLLQEASNIHTLEHKNRSINSEMICSIIPRHVKHLKLKTDRIKNMKMILERLDHLVSITFQFPVGSLNYSTNIIKWLKQRETSFTFWCDPYPIHLWFPNNISRLKDTTKN